MSKFEKELEKKIFVETFEVVSQKLNQPGEKDFQKKSFQKNSHFNHLNELNSRTHGRPLVTYSNKNTYYALS